MTAMGEPPTVAELAGADVAPVLDRLRAAQPVAWIPALDGWLVTRHDLAVAVMRDDSSFTVDDPRFSTAQVVGPSMLSLDGDQHRRHRRPFAPAFRAAELDARFAGPVQDLVDALVDRIHADGRADLRVSLAGPLSVAVVAQALGLTNIDVDTVLGWYAAIVGAVTSITAGAQPAQAAASAMTELGAAVRSGLDTVGASLLHQARGPLADDQVVSNAAVMMFGGIETTEGMIGNALVHLLGAPAALASVRADPALTAAAIEESLRLEPAAAVVDRYATRRVRLGAADIERGQLVRVSLAGANRDPAVFTDPHTFDPHRSNLRQQVAFARGPHACIAMDLARLETRVAVRSVLEHLPGLRLDGAAPVTGLVFRKPAAVPVRWELGT